MSLNRVPAGRNIPDDFNVIIEIPAHADRSSEVDKETGACCRPVHRYGDGTHALRLRVPKSPATTAIRSTSCLTPYPLQPGVVAPPPASAC